MGLEDRCLELLVLAQPSPLSTFNLDEAIAESLRAEAEFRRYNASATALTDCLESNGFVELSVDLTRDELLQGYEALTYVEPALASSGTSHFDSSIGSFVIRPIAPVMTVPPTALQFYFDLFGLGDPEKHASRFACNQGVGARLPTGSDGTPIPRFLFLSTATHALLNKDARTRSVQRGSGIELGLRQITFLV